MNEEKKYTQTSLAGGGINEDDKLRQAKMAELQKKYRLMSAALIAVIILAVVLFGANCNGNKPENNQVRNPEETNSITTVQQPMVDELTISESALHFTRVGDYADLSSNIADVQWSTNEPNIVSVSENGRVRALNGGTAEIYAKYNDTTKVCTVTVDTYVPSEDEINEARRQLQIIEDYETQYTTYTYAEVQAMYDAFVNAGNTVTPHSYPGTTIQQCDNAKIVCYYADWYYNLAIYYYDSSNRVVYRDEYTVVTNGSLNTNSPTYSDWFVSSVHNQLFTINTENTRYYCYHDARGGAFSWLHYETEYADRVASRSLVIADYLS